MSFKVLLQTELKWRLQTFKKIAFWKDWNMPFLRLTGKQPQEPATWRGKGWPLVLLRLILLRVFTALCSGKGFLGSLHLAPKWSSRWTDHDEKAEQAALQLQPGSISKDSRPQAAGHTSLGCLPRQSFHAPCFRWCSHTPCFRWCCRRVPGSSGRLC